MPGLKDKLEKAQLPTKTLKIPLRGDIPERISQLEDQIAELSTKEAKKADPTQVRAQKVNKLRKQLKGLEAEAEASTLAVKIKALSGYNYRTLVAKFPLGESSREDEEAIRQREDFAVELARQCIQDVDGEELTEELWQQMLNVFNNAQMVLLTSECVQLNTIAGLPFSFGV